jgi:hypothetical protein
MPKKSLPSRKSPGNSAPARAQRASAVLDRPQVDFPPHIVELIARELRWKQQKARPLFPTERAELHSWLRFPEPADAYLHDLLFKQILSEDGAGPPLSSQELADLSAAVPDLSAYSRDSADQLRLLFKRSSKTARPRHSPE